MNSKYQFYSTLDTKFNNNLICEWAMHAEKMYYRIYPEVVFR